MDIEFEKKKFIQSLEDHGIKSEAGLFEALGGLNEKQQYILRAWVNLMGVFKYESGYSAGKRNVQLQIKGALGIEDDD